MIECNVSTTTGWIAMRVAIAIQGPKMINSMLFSHLALNTAVLVWLLTPSPVILLPLTNCVLNAIDTV